jgi:ribonucleoside-diphosphate reductase alpha chain
VEGHPNIKMATSIIDYVFRVLGYEYLGRTDFVQVQPSIDSGPTELGEPESGGATAAPADDAPAAAGSPVQAPEQTASSLHSGANGSSNGINGSAQNGSEADQEEIATLVAIAQGQEPAVGGAQPDAGWGEQLSQMMGDAPFCDICGHITVRNGGCYKCLNCGNSLGCS